MSSPSLKSVAFGAVKGASAFGYVLAATLFCAACSGLPIVAGLLGGLGVGARFGVSAGVVSATVLTYSLVRARRSRRLRRARHRVAASRGSERVSWGTFEAQPTSAAASLATERRQSSPAVRV